jgi:hypothetical protein
VDPSNERAAFQESIEGGRSRVQVTVVIAAAALVVGIGLLANVTGSGKDEAPSPVPAASAPAVASSARPTARPTPAPTPVPTLAPMAAPVTTAWFSPTGALVADVGDTELSGLVADVDGTVWARRAGGVMNIDPQTGRAREWTLADDAAFSTSFLAPARQGGVWLVGDEAIRRFDGVRFRAVIDTPGSIWSLVEGDDGTLWAETGEHGLVRWADGTWRSDAPGRPSRHAADIEVDADGRIWTVCIDLDPGGYVTLRGVSVWDGSAWTTFAPNSVPGMRGAEEPSLFPADDGSMWAAAEGRLARFQAGGWTSYEVADLERGMWLGAVGGDGRLWFVRTADDESPAKIQVYDGSTLTTFDEEDGLPGREAVLYTDLVVMPGPGYVLASTGAGLYRLADGSWQPLELATPAGSPAPGASPLGGVASLAAVSRDEVWAVGPTDKGTPGIPEVNALFRFDGTAWERQPLPVEANVAQVALAPDGTLWLATGAGPLVRRDGAWIDLGAIVAGVVPEPGEVDEECGGAIFIADDEVAYYVGPRSGNRVVVLSPGEGGWQASLYPAPVMEGDCPATLAATADGTIWALVRGWGSRLLRSTGGTWETVPPPSDDRPEVAVDPSAIAVDRDGSLWLMANTFEEASGIVRTEVAQQVEGRWVRRGGGEGAWVQALALLPDGSLIAVGDGIATLDGQRLRWSWRGMGFDRVSVAPDGAVWVAGPNVYRLPLSSS